MTPFQMTSSLDGKEIFARHWPVDNPVAVMTLIHGFGEHCGRYDHMASHLNANNIAVLSMDLRGHGQTEGKRGVVESYDHLISDVACLIKKSGQLYPNIPQYLFGHSMGGGIVLKYGLSQGDSLDGYLVSAPFILPAKPVPAVMRFIVRLLHRLLPRFAIANPIDGTKISSIKAEQDAYEADPLNHGTLGIGLAVNLVETGEDLLARAAEWKHPLLLWHAKQDQLTSFEATEKFETQAQNCKFTAFEDVEHEMHNDACRNQVYAMMVEYMIGRTV